MANAGLKKDTSSNLNAMIQMTTLTLMLCNMDPSSVDVSTKTTTEKNYGNSNSSNNISATNPVKTNATTFIDTMSTSSIFNNSNTNIIVKLEAIADPTTTTPGGPALRKGGKILSIFGCK